jgi:protein-L-isoaspartate(D-aspartate) O-methyltransferase
MLNLDKFGSYNTFSWTHDYLIQVLTTGKNPIVKKQNLITAFRTVKREDFVPESVKPQAYEDKDLNIGYGCVLNKPTVIAEMLSLMEPVWGGNYLDIGTGSGYIAALLGVAAGENGKVSSVERVQFLVDIAKLNIAKYPDIKNVNLYLKDGSLGLRESAPFDGIHTSVAFEKVPDFIANQLKIGGKLICPTVEDDVRVVERVGENEFKETVVKGYFFTDVQQGIE